MKQGTDVRDLVTAASTWNARAIGVAVGYGRADVGIVLSITNMLVLLILKPVRRGGKETSDKVRLSNAFTAP